MPSLTATQRKVYSFILDHIEQVGYQPSVREMGRQFRMSVNGVKGHRRSLERKGLIRFTGKNRGLELPGMRFFRASIRRQPLVEQQLSVFLN